MINDLYLNSKWSGPTPYDKTCSSIAFEAYKPIFYNGYFLTCGAMACLGFLILIFSFLAGTSEHEALLKGYKNDAVAAEKKVEETTEIVQISSAVVTPQTWK